jgi:hypothetical protein
MLAGFLVAFHGQVKGKAPEEDEEVEEEDDSADPDLTGKLYYGVPESVMVWWAKIQENITKKPLSCRATLTFYPERTPTKGDYDPALYERNGSLTVRLVWLLHRSRVWSVSLIVKPTISPTPL